MHSAPLECLFRASGRAQVSAACTPAALEAFKKLKTGCPRTLTWGFPENRGTPFLGVPLRGFYSVWGIKGVPPILGSTHHLRTAMATHAAFSPGNVVTGRLIVGKDAFPV